MYVACSMRRLLLAGSAFFLALSCGFAETKAGKVTGLSLNPETNEKTVTVTLGELQLPKKSDGKKTEIFTIGSETVTFTLGKDVSVGLYRPRRQKQDETDVAVAEESEDENNLQAPEEGPEPAVDEEPRGMPGRPFAGRKLEKRLAEKLELGSLVQLVYSDDGKSVVKVELLPDRSSRQKVGMGHMQPMGMRPGFFEPAFGGSQCPCCRNW